MTKVVAVNHGFSYRIDKDGVTPFDDVVELLSLDRLADRKGEFVLFGKHVAEGVSARLKEHGYELVLGADA